MSIFWKKTRSTPVQEFAVNCFRFFHPERNYDSVELTSQESFCSVMSFLTFAKNGSETKHKGKKNYQWKSF